MQVLHYLDANRRDHFQEWLDSLRDTKGRIAVLRRIDRLMDGNNVLLRALGLRIAVQPLRR